MQFFQIQQHTNAPACIEVIAISDKGSDCTGNGWVSRWDWKTLEAAQEVADAASVFSGIEYIAIDAGANTFPRFDVIRAPSIGDPVSYTFNGDYYPCGYIASISKSAKKITTTTGETFYRSKQSGSWLMGRTWAMIKGHISVMNPHF